ncbi:LysR substrate-binding domain-containing protein [Streptomyces sp. NPDC051920]|uniref:LysR family transcriptional regulator n=1 Tax=Streptomyces sp. NPDC051920 TaxID=3155523 RepID=UPI003432AB41
MTVDLDTRRLRSFIAVAEELNFTRAARRLFIAQQALSQQVRQLEEELGVKLLERTTRRVTLTDAGESFLVDARRLVADAESAVDRARLRAAGKTAVLRLGFTPAGIRPGTRRILAAFEARHPEVEVLLREMSWEDPSAGLAGGSAEAAIIQQPCGVPGLRQVAVCEVEPRLVMSPGNPLAGRSSVDANDLAGVPAVAYDVPEASFFTRWNVGFPAARARSVQELLSHAAGGRGFAVVSEHSELYHRAPGVTFRRVTGVPPLRIAFATREDEHNPLVRSLLACAEDFAFNRGA